MGFTRYTTSTLRSTAMLDPSHPDLFRASGVRKTSAGRERSKGNSQSSVGYGEDGDRTAQAARAGQGGGRTQAFLRRGRGRGFAAPTSGSFGHRRPIIGIATESSQSIARNGSILIHAAHSVAFFVRDKIRLLNFTCYTTGTFRSSATISHHKFFVRLLQPRLNRRRDDANALSVLSCHSY